MLDPCRYEGARVLLVEGKDDCHVVLALCQAHNLPQTFGVYQCDGDDNVLRRFNALIPEDNGPEVIGVVLDTDQHGVMGRWQQIQQSISDHHYTFPSVPDINGTILPEHSAANLPQLGIWLMPNNQDPGMLEDFLMKMADQYAIIVAEWSVQTAELAEVASFKSVHRSKAILHTYLAWQDEPGKPPGQSVTSHALHPDTDIAYNFTDWLQRLFCQ